MFVYWFIVLVPSVLALAQSARRRGALDVVALPVLLVLLFIFLALRETGGDYETYLGLFSILSDESLDIAMSTVEPIYGLLNWISAQWGTSIYGVNAVCALVFLFSLYRAAQKERHPFLLVTLAIPYFVIVVAMGYTRQGVASGLLLLATVYLREQRTLLSCAAIVLGVGFHFSVFPALALPILVGTRRQTSVMAFMMRLAIFFGFLYSALYLFNDRIEIYSNHYIASDRYQSGGAFLRSLVTAAAGVVFFLFLRNYRRTYDDNAIWLPFAVLGLLSLPLSLVASTPVDRLGLYLIPFQIVTFCRLPTVIDGGRKFMGIKTIVIAAYLAYFFTWLHLGAFAGELWVPYRWIFS